MSDSNIIFPGEMFLDSNEKLYPIEIDSDSENSNIEISKKKINELNNDEEIYIDSEKIFVNQNQFFFCENNNIIETDFGNSNYYYYKELIENQDCKKNFYNDDDDDEDAENKSTNDIEDKNQNQNNQEQKLINNNKNNFDDIIIEIDNKNFDIKKFFVGKKRKLGRKTKKENIKINKKIRRKFRTDNIDKKIKNFIHKSIIKFLNIVIIKIFGSQKRKFRKIAYKIIIKMNNKEFFNQKLKNFIEKEITSRYKRKPKTINKKNSDYLSEEKKIKDLLEKTVGYFFKNYFIKDYFDLYKNIKKVDEELKLEINTKKENKILCFDDFIKKLRENEKYDEFYIKKVEERAEKILKENFDDDKYIDNHKNKKNKKLFYIEK